MTALLQAQGLRAGYGDLQALFDVDLTVDEGTCVAIIGANGAGKSTLLGTIAGEVALWSGSMRYAGEDLAGRRTAGRVADGIALVPEGRRLFPSLTVEENLRLGAYRGRPGPWTLPRVYELFPRLAERRNISATSMSGGEQQACAIGRALLSNPRLLLLDEVSLGLAPVIVKQIYDRLPTIRSEGTTVVVVEQDVTQALAAADHVVCLLEGRVSLTGRPEDLARDAITAAYFGTEEVAS